ncbi:FMN-dependent NADH-azoreductase (fragment) [Burkholderiales bacterium]
MPHLDAARFQALLSAPAERSPEQQAVVSYSDTLIEELQAADVIVLGLPMYNFGIPSQLKAYFDHVARAGVTFRYSEKGPVGLLTGKRAYVFATRGGYYRNTAKDTQSLYVRDFLSFIGIDDIQFIYAEGLAISDTSKQRALRAAQTAMGELLEELAQAA